MEFASGRTVAIIAMMCNGQVLRSIRGSFLFTLLYALGVKSTFHHLNSSALSFQPDAPTCKYILYDTIPCHAMSCHVVSSNTSIHDICTPHTATFSLSSFHAYLVLFSSVNLLLLVLLLPHYIRASDL